MTTPYLLMGHGNILNIFQLLDRVFLLYISVHVTLALVIILINTLYRQRHNSLQCGKSVHINNRSSHCQYHTYRHTDTGYIYTGFKVNRIDNSTCVQRQLLVLCVNISQYKSCIIVYTRMQTLTLLVKTAAFSNFHK